MINLKTIMFFLVTTLLSFSVQAQPLSVEQHAAMVNGWNDSKLWMSGDHKDAVNKKGVPANVDTEVRRFIMGKFGGLEAEQQYGDRWERKLQYAEAKGKNFYGKKYDDFTYYTYMIGNFVNKTDSKGVKKAGPWNYEHYLDVIMKPNGEINEYKWTTRNLFK